MVSYKVSVLPQFNTWYLIVMCTSYVQLIVVDGEDGTGKIWSRTGMLRTILAQSGDHYILVLSTLWLMSSCFK